jgi:hypothetical protein
MCLHQELQTPQKKPSKKNLNPIPPLKKPHNLPLRCLQHHQTHQINPLPSIAPHPHCSCQENTTKVIKKQTTTTTVLQNNKCKWKDAVPHVEKQHKYSETDIWTTPLNSDNHFYFDTRDNHVPAEEICKTYKHIMNNDEYLDAKLSLLDQRLDEAFDSDEMNAAF